jgi:hypothetical protein
MSLECETPSDQLYFIFRLLAATEGALRLGILHQKRLADFSYE